MRPRRWRSARATLPVARAAKLVAALTGVHVPAGFAAATAARAAGQASLDETALAGLKAGYLGAVAKGIADNQCKRTRMGKDGLRLARRFRDHQDMILRFAADLAVGFTSSQAERDAAPP